MSFLDSALFSPSTYGSSGGLLGNILRMAQANPVQSPGFPQPQTQAPQTAAPVQAPLSPQNPFAQRMLDNAQLPANSQPTVGQLPQAPSPSSSPLFGGSGLGGMLGGLLSVIAPRHSQALMQQQALQASYQALRQSGVPDAVARAAALNPSIMNTIAGNYFDTKPQFGVIGQDQMGVNQYGFIRPNQMSVTPVGGQGNVAGGGKPVQGNFQIDPSLSGQPLLDAISKNPQMGPGEAQKVKGIAEGKIPYPTGFIMKTPYGRWLTTMVGQYEPGVDATMIGQRRTFNQQLGSTQPNSVGGQKILMGTALGHLGEVADAAADLGNVNTPVAMLGHGVNAVRNMSTDQAAKVNKLNETVDRFSGEVGKLYSGSQGGGVTERAQTKSRFGGDMTPAELAAGLEASRDLIQSKLQALQAQHDTIFGPNEKMDFLGDNGRAALTRIDAAIAKLKGNTAAGTSSQPSSNIPAVGQRQVGQTYQTPKGPAIWRGNGWQLVQ